MNNQITFSQALEGYLLYADASRLSPCTIADYTNIFRKFQAFLGDDPPIAEITAEITLPLLVRVRMFFPRFTKLLVFTDGPHNSASARPPAHPPAIPS